jgi:anti-sigma factor RsiW
MTDRARLETLIQAHLDGELTDAERDELAAAVASDPAARRLRDEYVALEGLLFAVGSSERTESPGTAPPRAAAASSRRRPALARPAAWLVPALAAAALLAFAWVGVSLAPLPRPADTGGSAARSTAPRELAGLHVTDLSPGHIAVEVPCEHPDVQIVWLYRLEPRPDERELR